VMSPEKYEVLKDSIHSMGVQQPVVEDEFGRLIAGRHRKRASGELGVPCPTITVAHLTRQQKEQLAYELDFCRKDIDRKVRKCLARRLLKQSPTASDRQVGRMTGLDHKTVTKERRELESGGEIPRLTIRDGKDGKRYKLPTVYSTTA